MSTADTLNSIREHIGDAYDEISRLGVDLTDTNKNIQNIGVTLGTGLTLVTPVQGTGSNVSLSPTLKGGLDTTPIGNCEQDSYSGQQLIDCNDMNALTNATLDNNDYFNINYVNSTETNAFANIFFNSKNLYSVSTQYAVVIEVESGSAIIHTSYSSTNSPFTTGIDENVTTGTYVYKLTTKSDLSNTLGLRLYVTLPANTTTQIKLRCSVIADTTITPQTFVYQKYVGGIPSPNPDYPQDVRVVTGDNDVVVQNRNFFNSANLDNVTGETNIEKLATGFKFTKTSTSRFSAWFDNFIPSGTYKFVGTFTTNDTTQGNRLAIQILYIDNTQTTSYINLDSTPLTLDKDVRRLRLYAQSGYADNNWYQYENFMLLKSTETDTSYVPHAEQKVTLHLGSNYLAGIGDYKDTIVGKTDNWKIVRKVGKVVLNGSETYNTNQDTTNSIRFTTSAFENNRPKVNNVGLSNYFIVQAESFKDGLSMYQGDKNAYIWVLKTLADNTSAFATWVSIHNIEICYPLTTPTEETITDTTLINDLNNMYNLMGYDGTTNISITSNSVNAQMTAQVKALNANERFSENWTIIRKDSIPSEYITETLSEDY